MRKLTSYRLPTIFGDFSLALAQDSIMLEIEQGFNIETTLFNTSTINYTTAYLIVTENKTDTIWRKQEYFFKALTLNEAAEHLGKQNYIGTYKIGKIPVYLFHIKTEDINGTDS